MKNIILSTDSYKASHWLQYPPDVTGMYSYLESRGGRYGHTLFFGLQYLLKEYLSKPVTMADVEQAKTFFAAHGEPFNYEAWKYIAIDLKGKLPIRIRAVPEGSIVPVHNLLMDVESTDPKCFWLVSWLETMLMRIWYPVTVATQSWNIKQLIRGYLERTSDDPNSEILFKLHDFGARGVSSSESAAIGGASHLINFKGSDTVEGVVLANEYYNEPMAGFSIPASEHSTMTAWGKDHEVDAYRNMIKQYGKPGALLAVVSDSYDLWNALENMWGKELRDEVIASGATVVVRPDSGDPASVVLKTLTILAEKFGFSYNTKAHKVINNVRVLQGDGVNEESIREILELITKNGFSATNLAFGMGGALLQQVNRDTQKFAYKCSDVIKGGHHVGVNKDPITDPGKASKKGRLDLIRRQGKLQTVAGPTVGSELVTVFENGVIKKEYTFAEIRLRSNKI